MAKPKVIIDTNQCANKSPTELFGERKRLRQISPFVNLFIPQIALDELIAQKRRKLQSEKDKFKANIVFARNIGS